MEAKIIINLHIPGRFYAQLMREKPEDVSRNTYFLALLTKGYYAVSEEESHAQENRRVSNG